MTARHLILSLALVMVLSACGGSGTDDTPSPGESLAIETCLLYTSDAADE